VDQLCGSLGLRHKVIVHHDFSIQPSFRLRSANATLIPDPIKTDWGGWGQVAAIIRLLREAHSYRDADYFQLLSDSCLPIRPIEDYEEYLSINAPDALFEAMPLDGTRTDVMLNFAYRHCPSNRLEKTIIRRLSRYVLGSRSGTTASECGGLVLEAGSSTSTLARLALGTVGGLTRHANRRLLPSTGSLYCGSTWFGVSASFLPRLLNVIDRYSYLGQQMRVCGQNLDECLFPTWIQLAEPSRTVGYSHYLSWRGRGTGPDELTLQDLADAVGSRKYFARKFPKDPASAVRAEALGMSSFDLI
jgi:hypothetical protein